MHRGTQRISGGDIESHRGDTNKYKGTQRKSGGDTESHRENTKGHRGDTEEQRWQQSCTKKYRGESV
ncbi:MAG: hypothetical protein LLG13_10470 [Bacteroidales bacterium]|nr:hypothetical protein [Bacteroidales bacterium]